jgi:biopolymer transport protein TolQ
MIYGILILQSGGVRASIPALVASASLFSKLLLILLVVISVVCWAIVWDRLRLIGRVERANRDFLAAFRRLPPASDLRLACEQHPASPLARLALAGQRALDRHPAASDPAAPPTVRMELAQRAMERAAGEEAGSLERHVGTLATAGSVSPFIGLLGTVWGVMISFLNIGAQGSASLVVVAPGIAEALIATVAGLAAAIPAVVAYNHFVGRLRVLDNAAVQFTGEFLDRRLGGAGA